MQNKRFIVRLDLQIATKTKNLPSESQFRQWIRQTLLLVKPKSAALCVRLVDQGESATLNEAYRKKTGPTNILSFSYDPDTEDRAPLLGDLVICAPLVEQEAQEQGKDPLAHWTHLTIHGTLHLLGYDHQTPQDAQVMEAQEIKILAKLGLPNPYT